MKLHLFPFLFFSFSLLYSCKTELNRRSDIKSISIENAEFEYEIFDVIEIQRPLNEEVKSIESKHFKLTSLEAIEFGKKIGVSLNPKQLKEINRFKFNNLGKLDTLINLTNTNYLKGVKEDQLKLHSKKIFYYSNSKLDSAIKKRETTSTYNYQPKPSTWTINYQANNDILVTSKTPLRSQYRYRIVNDTLIKEFVPTDSRPSLSYKKYYSNKTRILTKEYYYSSCNIVEKAITRNLKNGNTELIKTNVGGDIIQKILFNHNNDIILDSFLIATAMSYNTYDYEYDNRNNWIKRIRMDSSNNPDEEVRRVIEYR